MLRPAEVRVPEMEVKESPRKSQRGLPSPASKECYAEIMRGSLGVIALLAPGLSIPAQTFDLKDL